MFLLNAVKLFAGGEGAFVTEPRLAGDSGQASISAQIFFPQDSA
jgi:hypothetical protein